MSITLYENDLPDDFLFPNAIAIDTETQGLNPARDRLCLVQLSAGDGHAHLIKIAPGSVSAPNLRRLLADERVEKIFHFARFDMAVLQHCFGIMPAPVFCTKIASKIARTYAKRHGLRELVQELLRIDLSKQEQSSDWGAETLSDAQLAYAASDVLHLHELRDKLSFMLQREGRYDLARECFAFLKTRCQLDLAGWQTDDIFSH